MQGSLREYKKYTALEQQRLLASLAEQLKLPLLQIAREAELAILEPKSANMPAISLIAETALELVDSYLLSLRLRSLEESALEPVSLSAVLHKTAQRLHKLADLYGCDLELDLAGQYPPVMAHAGGLEAALHSLGSVFIEAQGSQMTKKRHVVTLAAHRSRWGLVAGIYSDNMGLNTEVFRKAKLLYGQARQPINQVLSSAGAGVFVADSLFGTMASQLRPARHHRLTGLAATLTQSHQLTLV